MHGRLEKAKGIVTIKIKICPVISSGHNRRNSGGSPKTKMAAALSPVTSLRFKPHSAVRLLSAYTKTNPRYFPTASQIRMVTLHFPQPYHPPATAFTFFGVGVARHRRRSFCTVISGALSSGEAIEKPKPEFLNGEKVGEFRKRLKVVDIKGGPDEGLDRLGQTLVVMGWVRTLRVQSSVIFIEVSLTNSNFTGIGG